MALGDRHSYLGLLSVVLFAVVYYSSPPANGRSGTTTG